MVARLNPMRPDQRGHGRSPVGHPHGAAGGLRDVSQEWQQGLSISSFGGTSLSCLGVGCRRHSSIRLLIFFGS